LVSGEEQIGRKGRTQLEKERRMRRHLKHRPQKSALEVLRGSPRDRKYQTSALLAVFRAVQRRLTESGFQPIAVSWYDPKDVKAD